MSEKRKQKELISVRVTTKFKEQLEKIGEQKGMTLPDLVRYVLSMYIEENNRVHLNDNTVEKSDIEQILKEFKEKCKKAGVKID